MISWNDRRKAKKAQSVETKKNLAAMAKQGTLRDGGPARTDKWDTSGHDERAAVHNEARQAGWEAGADPYARAKNYKTAAKRVSAEPAKFRLSDTAPMQANPKKKVK
jgi:hypothetical protein